MERIGEKFHTRINPHTKNLLCYYSIIVPDLNENFQKIYTGLNTEQRKAVDVIDGPVLVLAGPGTGKTQVLTMRIANILQKTDTPPDAVLALTFTESGVRAMRERLLSIIGPTAYYVSIHTFHSFSSEIIRANPDEFIISAQLESLSDLERVRIFKEIFDELDLQDIKPFNAPYYYLQTAISKIKDLKREAVDTTEYLKFIEKSKDSLEEKDYLKNIELQKVYALYQEKLKLYGRYDFEDMINFVIDRFKTSPTLLGKYQERYLYFLVDEFQDTNSAQAELLYQLSSFWDPSPNLFVVGDDDQSIYRFQGASIENIIKFNEKYPEAAKIALIENYRSIQPILDAAQNVISKNNLRISNKLEISKNQKSQQSHESEISISFSEFSSSYTENHFIATTIKELMENGINGNEIAIIYRNNSDSVDIADMLSRIGVEYTLEGGENVLQNGIIVRLMHLLRVIQKVRIKDEDLDIFTLLNYEFTGVKPLDVLKLSRFASSHKINFFEGLSHADIKAAGIENLESITNFYSKIVDWNESCSTCTISELIENILEESGYLRWILDQPANYEYLNKLNSFLSEVKRLNYTNRELKLEEFLKYIDLMVDNNISINEETIYVEKNAVRLMTAHKSKGLEFKYVFIPKFIDKKWSNTTTRDLIKLPNTILDTVEELSKVEEKLHQEEDDRRLFFVVLTRAKDHIYITSAKNYQTNTFSREGIPSMFYHELPQDNIEVLDSAKYEKNTHEILKELVRPAPDNTRIEADEEAFLKNSLKDFKLSASSLNSYLECGYKFKLEFLFKTPAPKVRALILGIAVHKALEMLHKELMSGRVPTFDYVKGEFTKELQKELLSEKEYSEIESEGISIMKIYHETYQKEFSEPSKNILFLEKFFGWGWSKPLLDGQIHLQGKVDKIISLNPADKTIKVVDYKTGKPHTRNEILGNTKYADPSQYRQLLFYKLLLELDKSFGYKVREVELDYIGNRGGKPKRELFTIGEGDLENLKDTIRVVYKSIHDQKFHKTKNYSICENCKFRYHCWPDGIPQTAAETENTSSTEQLVLSI
jgi:DNA helicase-2/ATP-dependent DNA helicase PcrA